MKFILKVLLAPIMLLLWLLTGTCKIILKISVVVFAVVSLLFAIMGIITIVSGSSITGVIGLIVAFILSPFGIPKLAALLVAQLYIFRLWLREKIYE